MTLFLYKKGAEVSKLCSVTWVLGLEKYRFAGVLCTDQLLFCAAPKMAVLKNLGQDSGSETQVLAIHCSVALTFGRANLPYERISTVCNLICIVSRVHITRALQGRIKLENPDFNI
jgi:hypothetical protein